MNEFSREEISYLMWEKPHFVQIELTRNCNFKCVFCFENCEKGKVFRDESVKKWKKVIDDLYDLRCETNTFFWWRKFSI